ncbi:hypothetical protein CLV35_1416 [Motilibacter peucedani]|uniref:GH15 family glucan-1,4-alpha-glucosidase n=1 Tax=Motilibacter peucedani TaxID=598650 RepID=A0A420XS57_9ACTN|nr:glycoside hydrolase family 15 [Motilibacter peucedani]RKS77718.1 hypothetical protein CLV35_1416 [Motilibacter peucedani]
MSTRWKVGGAVVAVLAISLTTAYATAEPRGAAVLPHPKTVGIAGRPGSVVAYASAPEGASWVPHSSVLRLADGSYVAAAPQPRTGFATPDPSADDAARIAALAEARSQQAWLAAGHVPGDPGLRPMAERALLDLRLLTAADGAVVAAPYGIWSYVWPRDSASVAAAYAVTAHLPEAVSVLRWVASQQRDDGTWAARTRPDGSGPPDDRPDQLDAGGWFSWAVWFVAAEQSRSGDRRGAEATLRELGPQVLLAARAVDARVDDDGMPGTTPDYWENDVSGPTLGTAAVLLSGMRAAADVARRLGQQSPASEVASRLEGALTEHWLVSPSRYADGEGGADAALAWAGPPFSPAGADRLQLLRAAETALRAPNGGLRPGERFKDAQTSWTPETAAFALAHAALGDRDGALAQLRWLDAHRTALGALPEKVDSTGRPVSVAPLAWTDATVLLALTALERPLPVP